MSQNDCIILKVLTPEKELVRKMVSKVSLSGTRSPFMVLRNHAPLITSLEQGYVRYTSGSEEGSIAIKSGFVEVKDNMVTVCAEV